MIIDPDLVADDPDLVGNDGDVDNKGIDYYVQSNHVESPSVHTPVCPYCGARCDEGDLDVLEDNTPDFRIYTKQGYCPHCSCYVAFDHQWSVESVISNRVHVRQNYTEEELNWRKLR